MGPARAAPSAALRARFARASSAWRREGGPEWGAVAIGSAQRGDEGRHAAGRTAALEALERRLSRRPEREPVRRPPQLGGQQARVAAADLSERAAGGQAGLDGDAQQLEDVRELVLHPGAPPAGAPQQPGVGGEEARQRGGRAGGQR